MDVRQIAFVHKVRHFRCTSNTLQTPSYQYEAALVTFKVINGSLIADLLK